METNELMLDKQVLELQKQFNLHIKGLMMHNNELAQKIIKLFDLINSNWIKGNVSSIITFNVLNDLLDTLITIKANLN